MIREFTPFPYVTPNKQERAGLLVTANSICIRCNTKECIKAYQDRVPGKIDRCFQGLDFVYAIDFDGEDIVWNGFLLVGSKYPGNHRTLLRDGYQLTPEALDHTRGVFGSDGQIHRAAVENQKRGESRALHDIKHLVAAIVRVVESNEVRIATDEYAAATTNNIDLMKSTNRSVYNILGALKNQIEMSDYILAPQAAEKVKEQDIDIFPLFEKNVHIYNVLATQQGKFIEIRSVTGFVRTRRRVKAHFALLPAILLQNAIKYSRERTTTTVEIAEIGGKVTITVKSIGPVIPHAQRQRIWKLGEQYVHANDTSKGGSGFGLYLARSICQSTGFTIEYEADFHHEDAGVPVGENRFILRET